MVEQLLKCDLFCSGFEVGPLRLEIPNAVNEVRSVLGEISATRNVSNTSVIDVDSGDDDEWTYSSLLKEVRRSASLFLAVIKFMFILYMNLLQKLY